MKASNVAARVSGTTGHLLRDRTGRTVPTDVHDSLVRAEELRLQQLQSLPTHCADAVSAAHRGSVERILAQIRTARRRLLDGLYHVCTGCDGTIPADRLEKRPWATTCARCARLASA